MDRKNANGNPSQISYIPSGTPRIRSLQKQESVGSVPPSPSLNISRYAYNVTQFNQNFDPIKTTKEEKIEKFKPDLSKKAWTRRFRSLFPITLWLPEYDIKENLMADILVGITIAIFQVPQSMGYCLIAHVPPVYGLYSSFFPALMYTILGTGAHCAFGPFALVSGVMTGDIVIQVMNELGRNPYQNNLDIVGSVPTPVDEWHFLRNIDIAIMVAIIIGGYILAFGILQLGFISNYMSQELISGFTTSASIIVFVSQLRHLLGANLGYFSGPFNLYYTIEDVVKKADQVNLGTLTISGIALATLLFFKLVVNPLTSKLGVKTPFPIELFVVIGGTVASHYLELHKHYDVELVGTIANKFPGPEMPVWSLFPYMWSKCIPTAIVGYTITLSVCKIYGRKHGYVADANQEMIAMGATNIFAAFFQCIPAAASLPRSALQDTAGGKTQIVSVVNCCCIVVVILALGRYLEELPVCVLGACIAVALVSLLSKIGEFLQFWKVSKLDGLIWIITFFGVLVLCVDYGIYIGLVSSLLLLIYKSQRPKTYILGTIDDSDIYVPVNKFKGVQEVNDTKIFQFCGPLNFSNAEFFTNELENKIGVNVTAIKKFVKSRKYKKNVKDIKMVSAEELSKNQMIRISMNDDTLPLYLIIDCSMFSYIDFSGISTLKKTIQSFEDIGIKTVLTGVPVHIESMFSKEGFFEEVSRDCLYKSVHDAVTYLQEGSTGTNDSVLDVCDSSNNQCEGDQLIPQYYTTNLTMAPNPISFNTFKNNEYNPRYGNFGDEESPEITNELKLTPKSFLHKYADKRNAPPPPPPIRDPTTSCTVTNSESYSPPSTSVTIPRAVQTPLSPPPPPSIPLNPTPASPPPSIPLNPTPAPPPLSAPSIPSNPNPPPPPSVPITNNSNTNQSKPTPSLSEIPPPPKADPIPSTSTSAIPPPPPIPTNIDPKLTLSQQIQAIKTSNQKSLPEDAKPTDSPKPYRFNAPKIHSNLKSRTEMLEKFLESRRISNA